jgi:hypothetical protein
MSAYCNSVFSSILIKKNPYQSSYVIKKTKKVKAGVLEPSKEK